jgi:AcrR family transcriptional regulator
MPYRPTPRTESRKAATRERILGAALDQLADGGYASASVQTVAQRAQVATGTLYRHFDSKSALFAEVFRQAAKRELDAFAHATSDDGRPTHERIGAGVEAFARRSLAEPTRAYALLAEPVDPAVEAERLTFRRGYRDVLIDVMQQGIDRDELQPHDTSTAGAALVGAIGEALVGPLSPANGGGPHHHEALVAGLVQFCIRALPRAQAARQEVLQP